MQYKSGKGERGLKQWAKSVSVTAQKVGLETFLLQTIMRVSDRLLLSRASDIVERQEKSIDEPSTTETTSFVKKRKQPHFRYIKVNNSVVAVDRKGNESAPSERSGSISPNVLAHMQKVERHMDVVDIWCEIKLPPRKENKEYQLLRAHPMLDKFGGLFDWVDARFEMVTDGLQDSDDEDEGFVAPSKLLAFYVDSSGDDCAVVHSVEWTVGDETALGNTRLVTNHHLEFQKSGWPAIRKISIDKIYRPIYVIERKKCKQPVPPKTATREQRRQYVVSVVTSRFHWAELFYWWARDEVKPGLNNKVVMSDGSDSMVEDDDSSGG